MENLIENEILQRLTGLEHAVKGNGAKGLKQTVEEQGRLLESMRNGLNYYAGKHELKEHKVRIHARLDIIDGQLDDLARKLDELMDQRRSKRENWKRLLEVWSLPSVLVLVQWALSHV